MQVREWGQGLREDHCVIADENHGGGNRNKDGTTWYKVLVSYQLTWVWSWVWS